MKITGRIELTGRGLYVEPYTSPADELCDFLNGYYKYDGIKKVTFELQQENEISFETSSIASAEDILEMAMDQNCQPEEVQNYMDEHEFEMLRVTFERDEA